MKTIHCLRLVLFNAMLLAGNLVAQGPNKAPLHEGTIKATATVDLRPFFQKQLDAIGKRKSDWLDKAARSTPPLHIRHVAPIGIVRMEKDSAAFQGWKAVPAGKTESILNRKMEPGESFILDFGQHLAGYLAFQLVQFDIPVDAPVRLALVFGEVPAEVAESFDPFPGTLTRAWLQDEVVNIDVVPQSVALPRRYAFRYVKVTVVSCSRHGRFGFGAFGANAVSSADPKRLVSFTPASEKERRLDQVSLVTLRDCMQTVFEDGPKRDRRLWLGDLRLQAQANYCTFRNNDLVKRSLYLLAGTATEQGLVSTCMFENPVPVRGGNSILDYTALLAPTVLDYLDETGDRKTADDLWPLVLKQLDFTLEPVSAEGLFIPPKSWWMFVDWHPTLDRQASEHAIILYGLKAAWTLGQRLGKKKDVDFMPAMIAKMEKTAREYFWSETRGVFVSGPKNEVSWASQAWMILAGVASPGQGRRSLESVAKDSSAVRPVTPYMHHHVVEAYMAAGMKESGMQYIHDYWGGMIDRGADAFWEVYVPEDPLLSPYKSHLINSYCHAWSCTPAYFLRKKK